MNEEYDPSNPKKKRRIGKKDVVIPRVSAISPAAAIRAMQDFGPQPMMNEKKENFLPGSAPPFQNSDNLVASNPFDDSPQQRYEIPTYPPQLPPQFIANPTPRRGITPDQIGNMNYMSMRYMYHTNQPIHAMNPMAYARNRFEHPPVSALNPMNSMRSMNNGPLGQIGNVNPMNNSGVGGLAMNGSTMISPMTGLRENRVSPMNSMMNVPNISPLTSSDHTNNILNVPPMHSMNGAYSKQMNLTRGHMQRASNMPMPGRNPHPVPMMGSNHQLNHMNILKGLPDMKRMNGNSHYPAGHQVRRNIQDAKTTMEYKMERNIQNAMSGHPAGQELHPDRRMLQPDMQGLIDPKSMTTSAASEDKIYPPNQPMVFNQHNPNAPPLLPCGVCRREVQATDQAILCESGCNFWFHRQCAGLTAAAHAMLINEPYAEWVCDKCVVSKDVPMVKFKP